MTQATVHLNAGLSTSEAAQRLQQYGPNAIPEHKPNPWLQFAKKFWGPIPWMLEATIVIEVLLTRYTEGAVITALLVFNALLSTVQEKRAADALALLRQNLNLKARVLRDGTWQMLPAEQVVPGDVIHIRMGDILPADVRVLEGHLHVDQSALTGESLPVEVAEGQPGYAGTLVQHGEATAEVIATGLKTRFGRVAQLVQEAKHPSQMEQVIFGIVRALIVLDGGLALGVLLYALFFHHLPALETLSFVLILLVASVPIALPATFTLATALGARELAHQGVLVTQLSAIEEAAGMDVLCSDKTGTITQNRLSLVGVYPLAPTDEATLLTMAAMASDPATQDVLDLAILELAQQRNIVPDWAARRTFIPFDPATKRSEAAFESQGSVKRAVKGAPHAIAALCATPPADLDAQLEGLAAQGLRILAVAYGDEQVLTWGGLLAFQDPPRPDSASLIAQLKQMGVRVIMVTGDSEPTARTVARQVGIGEHVCHVTSLEPTVGTDPIDCDVLAEVLPEHKFALVQALQHAGHVTGMTGDGVNDAPALRQAQVGIAVANATDVAKAAASLVLTQPGLSNIVTAIQASRRIYQRMLTYTLNKIIKTIQIVGFLSLGLILGGRFVVTPLQVILLLFANDFVTMSVATDNVRPSPRPDRWQVRAMTGTALALGLPLLLATLGIYYWGQDIVRLSSAQLQTLSFLTLIFTAQGMIYLVRERHHLWASRPSPWMMFASVGAVSIAILLAIYGIGMAALPLPIVLLDLLLVGAVLFLLDWLKVAVLRRQLNIA